MNRTERAVFESVAFKGYGVTRVRGQVVFVPLAVTGDEAWIEIVKEGKTYAIGRLKEILIPSPWRTSPSCPVFGLCGGCQWQHIAGMKQGEIKTGILRDILRRFARLADLPSFSFLPSTRPYGYRTRIQLKISRKKIGYYRERSHEIIEILHCPIADPLINRILDSLREALSSLSLLWKSEEVEINVSPHEEKGVLLVHLPSVQKKEREMATALLRRHPFLKGILLKTRRDRFSCGDPFLIYNVSLSLSGKQEELRFRVSPGSFSQIHTEQNQALIETVIDLSRVHQDERVLDLYSGIGNFTLPLALLSRKAIGVEEDNTAVQDACWNARLNRIDRVTFLHRRVKEGLVHWEGDKPDLVLLDPPRTGAADAVSPITELGPKRIVYVSCDPPTLARDLRLFSQKGYSLRAVSLIDMFPQTYHMEVAALLAPDAEPERG